MAELWDEVATGGVSPGKAFDLFTHYLMHDLPAPIVLSFVVMGCAIIYEVFFQDTQIRQLKRARKLCLAAVKKHDCAPILVRLAWHDSGTYDKNLEDLGWPEAGGAIGSIRTKHELSAPANAGLMAAIEKFLSPIKKACPLVSWADLIQMASVCAIEASGGPVIALRYGRMDGIPLEKRKPNFGLPDALPPFGGPNPESPLAHLRYVFDKYGMSDKDIVALSGAHTLGRAFKERSGTVKEGSDGGTEYTQAGCPFLGASATPGGKSWTKNWRKFDNSYYTGLLAGKDGSGRDPNLLALPTDTVLHSSKKFRPHFELFARDQAAWFEAYTDAHQRLSELGSQFSPPEGLVLREDIWFY